MKKIETIELTKKFGDFTAVDNLSIAVEEGEVRAIIGENGAGKTTLMNMLFGLLQPDHGEIRYNGTPVTLKTPLDAITQGVGMVHQHFKLVPSLTVYENLMLGVEKHKKINLGGRQFDSIFIDKQQEQKNAQELIDKFDFKLKANDIVSEISVGERQCLEILKMLNRNVEVLILDEPTAVLTPQEVKMMMKNLNELRRQGKTIVIITHKLAEVKMCADSISVIRAGKHVVTVNNKDASVEYLSEKMVGRRVKSITRTSNPEVSSEVVFEVKDLTAEDINGKKVFQDINFAVKRGEIVGVAGVEGNGQTELIMVLTGLMKATKGKIYISGKDVTGNWPDGLRKNRMGIIPEERFVRGLCTSMNVSYNLLAGYHTKDEFCSHGFMRSKAIQTNRDKQVQKFDVRLSSKDPVVSELSGGNAQKIIIAREIQQDPLILLACQPTRGLDLGSTEFVQRQLLKMRDEGRSIFLVSSDLNEVVGLSDRILVMYSGKIVGSFSGDDISNEELGLYMAGAKTMAEPVLAEEFVCGNEN